ncbi:MAG: Rpn family recombination-promoting nuclease/putative transposase (plasmid) [Candidatus Symbiodolus clandestinus]
MINEKTLVSFDFAIKYLLKHKSDYDIVENFISTLLATEGYKPVKITALLDGESNKEDVKFKKSIADLIVQDEQGTQYIIEIDRSYTNLFLHKACFNSCRLIVDNICSNQDYSLIKKIFHINLLYFPLSHLTSPLCHGKTIFHEIDLEHPQQRQLTDKGGRLFNAYNIFPEYFIISIPLFNDVIKQEIDEWLYLMKHSEVKQEFSSPLMKKVAERLNVLKMNQQERIHYQAYVNESLKERDYLVSAEEKGREEGERKKSLEIAKKMLAKGADLGDIEELTGLSFEEISRLRS